MNRIFIIFLLILFCLDRNTNMQKIESLFKEGRYQETLLEIQRFENSYFFLEKPKELILWKARLFSLYPETFEISIKFYQQYLSENPDPNIYYELFLLYLDIKRENDLLNLISGEFIPIELIFDPKIMILRNFLECYLKAKKDIKAEQILSLAQKIKDPYLKNYCILTRLSFYLKENDKNTFSFNLYNRNIINKQLNFFKTNATNPKEFDLFEKNITLLLNLLSSTKNSDHQKKVFCELQQRFPQFEISEISIENCRNLFKDSLLIQRNLIFAITQMQDQLIKPFFDDRLYQLKKQ